MGCNDDKYWKDFSGCKRRLCDMDTLHICVIIKFLDFHLYKVKEKQYLRDIRRNLISTLNTRIQNGDFNQGIFELNKDMIQHGCYSMYPDETIDNGEVLGDLLDDYLGTYKFTYDSLFNRNELVCNSG